MKKPKNLRSKSFTLLEVMVALSFLLIAGTFVGWNLYEAVQKKHFQSDMERLQARLQVCQHLAMAMQADWIGELKKEQRGWVFTATCAENSKLKQLAPLKMDPYSLFLEGKDKKNLTFNFFSTGQVFPVGQLLVCKGLNTQSFQQKWDLSNLFARKEGDERKNLGPLSPKNLE